MSFLFRGSSKKESTQTTVIPGPTPEERELTRIQVEASREGLEEIRALREDLPEIAELLELDFLTFTEITNRIAAQVRAGTPGFEALTNAAFEQIEAAGRPTELDIELIQGAVDTAFQAGAAQIQQGVTDSLENIRDVFAPGRGLRKTDSPVLDRAGLVAREGVRQTGSLAQTLQAQGAQALLDFPLRRQTTLLNNILNQQQVGTQALGQQSQLAENALTNRLKLVGLRGDIGLALAGLAPTGASALSTLTQARIAQPTISGTTTGTTTPPLLQTIGKIAGGIGSVALGGAAFLNARALPVPTPGIN